jgi:hypothetical protein
MKVLHLSLVIWLPLSLALTGQTVNEHTFDDGPETGPPPGFTFDSFRQPEPGRWTIEKEADNGFLCHQRDTARGYSLALVEGAAPSNLMVTARVRVPAGGRAGGLVWRYLDDRHYYSLVLDLARQKVTLIRVSGGHHLQLDSEDDLELDADDWHVLKVTHVGNTVKASLGGVHIFDDEDRRSTWWTSDTTRVGLIAAGDSRVEFDDVRFSTRGATP